MADDYPVTSRDDLAPAKNSFPDKKSQESFSEPMNPLNAPVPLRKGPPPPNGWSDRDDC